MEAELQRSLCLGDSCFEVVSWDKGFSFLLIMLLGENSLEQVQLQIAVALVV